MADPKDSKDGTYVYGVEMTCSGCSSAVERALKRVDGITADVDLDKQSVTVKDPEKRHGADSILSKIRKTGKRVTTLDRGEGAGPEPVAAAEAAA